MQMRNVQTPSEYGSGCAVGHSFGAPEIAITKGGFVDGKKGTKYC